MSQEDTFIRIKGAKTHNLKGISIDIPRNKFVVITGLSGSGKSSLAFDTLYAEGQRRYVESLSAYARQFLGRMQKPEIDSISGIPPAIAIQQKVVSRNPRSTVGTSTEIYDYLKLLFSRIGKTISPISGQEVKKHQVQDVVQFIMSQALNTKIMLLAPLVPTEKELTEQINIWQKQGFTRAVRYGQIVPLNELNTESCVDGLYLLIDRIIADGQQTTANRLADSVQTAFFEGRGAASVAIVGENSIEYQHFSETFEADGIHFQEPTEHLFDFNSPVGACPTCGGFGNIVGIDPDLVVPDKNLSIYEEAIACWRGEKMQLWNQELVYNASKFNFPIHTPFYQLTDEQKQLIWSGNEYFHGLNEFFKMLEEKQFAKIQYRVMLSRYRGKTTCPDCLGTRLRKEASYVYVDGKNINELCAMPIDDLLTYFQHLQLSQTDQQTASQLLIEIKSRLEFISHVGLGYLTLNRLTSSLSGGESQRINLAKSLGSSLVGSLYILDEPSIGLHPRDTKQLIEILYQLRDLGNTVVVVEHDEDIIHAADYIIDIGPEAGRLGGEIVLVAEHQGDKLHIVQSSNKQSYTLDFINGKEHINVPTTRHKWHNFIEVHGASENNLKNLNVKIPLNVMTVVTGVSGSGKSSLITQVLYPALKKHYGGIAEKNGTYGNLTGSLHLLQDVEFVDQNPIGKSSRSNPVTYIKAYDEIRKLFAEQQLSHQMGYTAAHFSFNTPGGRCEECQGEGTITVEMQFMADLILECEHCHGQRFKQDILDVLFCEKNIYDVLNMTVNQAIEFFHSPTNEHTTTISNTDRKLCERIVAKLKPLQDVGIGYIKLGQASSTLSGGESQRVKLATFLSQENAKPTMFIFDEPTTGLHYHDIHVLLHALNALVTRGHTVVIIEHNPAIIMASDHIIDLGPEGGQKGGQIVAEGTPEQVMEVSLSYTGQFLKRYAKRSNEVGDNC